MLFYIFILHILIGFCLEIEKLLNTINIVNNREKYLKCDLNCFEIDSIGKKQNATNFLVEWELPTLCLMIFLKYMK